MLPLYAGHPKTDRIDNAGLRFEKFFAGWNEFGAWTGGGHEKPIPENVKSEWVIGFAKSTVGHDEQLAGYAARTRALVTHLQGQAFTARTQGRLVAGTGRSHPIEVGLAWHHTLGVPYLPGSGFKGIVREWAEGWKDKEIDQDLAARLLGRQEVVGAVVFLDALPTRPVKLAADVMTPHYGDYYQGKGSPGDWLSPTAIPFLTVADGQEFLFAVVPADPAHKDLCGQAIAWLQDALADLGAGAKTAAGYGRFAGFEKV